MKPAEFVTVAILAKDKAHTLPLYLNLIENQTYPASKIKLYIRTNNNRDQTTNLLEQWIEEVKDRYSEIYYDSSDVKEPVHEYDPHEWNSLRFKTLGRLRQESVEWAKARGTHYFVADCDNFIIPAFISILLILIVLLRLKNNIYVGKVFEGIRAASAGLILLAAVRLGKNILKVRLEWIIALASFIAIVFFNVNAAWAIIFGGLTGVAVYLWNGRKRPS